MDLKGKEEKLTNDEQRSRVQQLFHSYLEDLNSSFDKKEAIKKWIRAPPELNREPLPEHLSADLDKVVKTAIAQKEGTSIPPWISTAIPLDRFGDCNLYYRDLLKREEAANCCNRGEKQPAPKKSFWTRRTASRPK